ncbi:uncharacterized protein BO97DRAFT_14336 [Aspergillus homomorphus CBS 101889]|uniref:Uncharacterized protein n=1 Tax=Aspergillus homomorphus (strain CBS 101889) TaxID=1450537 RepID=A0A395IF21_ASPHC|nr:hypothetical protein BO97DRAFT_14336 [Aspergillus homomorphus CBS 101889]RAL17768.1 hypothetical protein BO97DRAFT_14336 [Aspergillus homomorphus CBS 101889]
MAWTMVVSQSAARPLYTGSPPLLQTQSSEEPAISDLLGPVTFRSLFVPIKASAPKQGPSEHAWPQPSKEISHHWRAGGARLKSGQSGGRRRTRGTPPTRAIECAPISDFHTPDSFLNLLDVLSCSGRPTCAIWR